MKTGFTVGLTMGDPAGVGPELCLRVLRNPPGVDGGRVIVFGSVALLERVAGACGVPLTAECIAAAACGDARFFPGNGPLVIDDPLPEAVTITPGRVQTVCGAAAARYIEMAVAAAGRGAIDAVVTAPVHKAALRLAGVPFPGHTEMLAALTGTERYCMMMAANAMNVCLVTTHIALAQVPVQLTTERILEVIRLADAAIRRTGVVKPRLTVCGLNPHAGEHGLFGIEEERVILPAVRAARSEGISACDPVPADTAFIPALRAQTDVYIVMYHDQGLIPFKMLAFETGVNITLGLPIVRTSVDHGTAFDIAWQGKASPASMFEAVRMAGRLAGNEPL